MTLALRYAAMSHVGLLRSGNEDSLYAGPRLLAVADGMGGHAAGEVASAVAIASVARLDEDAPGSDLLEALERAAVQANEHLREMVAGDSSLDGMGTTLTTLLFTGTRLALLHIGDSRCYLLRDGVLTQITHDDTLVQSLVDEGRISEEEAGTHPQRSLITRALDGRSTVDFEASVREVRAGDRYLLCTDGLTGPVSRRETLQEALELPDPQAAVERLVQLALRGGGPDNVTVVVADVVTGHADGTPVVAGAAAEFPLAPPAHLADGAAGRAATSRAAALRPADPAGQDAPDGEPRPAPARPDPSPGPSRVRRAGLAALVVVATLAVVVGGLWTYLRAQWFVGADQAQVSVFRGISGSVGGVALARVTERTALPVDALPELDQEGVRRGIPADDPEDARRIVATLQERARDCCAPPAPAPPAPAPPAPAGPAPAPPAPAGPAPAGPAPASPPPAPGSPAPVPVDTGAPPAPAPS